MGISVQCKSCGVVSQHARHGLNVYTVLQCQCGEGMPEVVEPNLRQSCSLQHSMKHVQHAVRGDWAAIWRRKVCREIGAIKQWTKKQSDDPVFKIYRREYKKRFARIKGGNLDGDDFKVWSRKAREEKKKCDSGTITLEEFKQWLAESE